MTGGIKTPAHPANRQRVNLMIPNRAAGGPEIPAMTAVPESFRALRQNEVVRRGDFIAAGPAGYEPWEGPNGFRADAFVKSIYRKRAGQPTGDGRAQ